MITFTVRSQATGGSVRSSKVAKWAEIKNEDIRITIDGNHRSNSLRLTVEANGIKYMLTDVLLEVMLGEMAEDYSNRFLNFNVYQKS